MSCAEVFPNQMKKVRNKDLNFGTPLRNVQCPLQQFIRNFPFLNCIMQTVRSIHRRKFMEFYRGHVKWTVLPEQGRSRT
jgi:hypothetical protein